MDREKENGEERKEIRREDGDGDQEGKIGRELMRNKENGKGEKLCKG